MTDLQDDWKSVGSEPQPVVNDLPYALESLWAPAELPIETQIAEPNLNGDVLPDRTLDVIQTSFETATGVRCLVSYGDFGRCDLIYETSSVRVQALVAHWATLAPTVAVHEYWTEMGKWRNLEVLRDKQAVRLRAYGFVIWFLAVAVLLMGLVLFR